MQTIHVKLVLALSLLNAALPPGSSLYAQKPGAVSTPAPAADLPALLNHIGQQWETIRPQVSRNSLIFQRFVSRDWQVEFKSLGTSNTVSLTGAGWFVGLPRVSRDGTTFYFLTNPPRNAGAERYVIALPLRGRARVHATLPPLGAYYDLSPDGKQVAYTAKVTTGSSSHVYIMDVDTNASRQFTADGVGGLLPSWSPDGQSIAYVSQRKLRVKTVATGAERIIVDDALLKELPTWSPDGKTIAYQGSANDEWSYELFRVDVETGAVNQLTRSQGLDVNPVFTADGQSIIFASDRETRRNDPTLYIMNRDGANVRRDMTAGSPVYLPNISLSAVVLDKPEIAAVETAAPPVLPAETAPGPVVATPTGPAPAIPLAAAKSVSSEGNISYRLPDLLESLAERRGEIDQVLDGNHIFYQLRTTTGILLQASTPGSAKATTLAALPHSSVSRPDASLDRTKLFFKFIDQSARVTHIIQLQRNQPAKALATLPLVPDLALENFDVADDGSKLYFDVRVDEQTAIYFYDVAAGTAAPVLPLNRGGIFPALSPDQRRLAYIASGKLIVIDLGSGAETTVADDQRLKQHPAWSPDGLQIIYQASEATGTGFDLYATDVAGKNARAMVATNGDDMTPSFAPGSQKIVYTNDGDTPGSGVLYSVGTDGVPVKIDVPDAADVLNVR